eukprot:Trichotokara_eunicae@DN2742_c0_g1_i2.p1
MDGELWSNWEDPEDFDAMENIAELEEEWPEEEWQEEYDDEYKYEPVVPVYGGERVQLSDPYIRRDFEVMTQKQNQLEYMLLWERKGKEGEESQVKATTSEEKPKLPLASYHQSLELLEKAVCDFGEASRRAQTVVMCPAHAQPIREALSPSANNDLSEALWILEQTVDYIGACGLHL